MELNELELESLSDELENVEYGEVVLKINGGRLTLIEKKTQKQVIQNNK